MKEVKNIDVALDLFEASANKHAVATEIGDYRSANKAYADIIKSLSYIRSQSEIAKLRSRLSSESVGVRLWSATCLLLEGEGEPVKVLESIASNEKLGIHSLTARVTLDEWKKGNLKILG